jgi:ribosomal protein S18 acetylase RimI-like enzyme
VSTTHILDNPVWASLSSSHEPLSLGRQVKRYASEQAPFIAVRDAEPVDVAELTELVAVDEALYFVGTIPALPPEWSIESQSSVLQMICERTVPIHSNGVKIAQLSNDAVDDMLELTALVFPGFFRRRTPEMGSYVGIWDGKRLGAMAGERMFAGHYREISAVCTHPDYSGRGYAAQLIAHLVNLNLAEGKIPFLHVSPGNTRAKSLYERVGFSLRSELALSHARRVR